MELIPRKPSGGAQILTSRAAEVTCSAAPSQPRNTYTGSGNGVVTLRPTASTLPTISWPGTTGMDAFGSSPSTNGDRCGRPRTREPSPTRQMVSEPVFRSRLAPRVRGTCVSASSLSLGPPRGLEPAFVQRHRRPRFRAEVCMTPSTAPGPAPSFRSKSRFFTRSAGLRSDRAARLFVRGNTRRKCQPQPRRETRPQWRRAVSCRGPSGNHRNHF